MYFRHLFCAIALVLVSTAAHAQANGRTEVPRGLWQGEADAHGLSFHVRTRRCGRAMCGRVERVKNRRGFDAPSNAVGQKVLWDLKPQADGSFSGEYRDSGGNSWHDTRVELRNNTLRLHICNAKQCHEENWKRLR